MNYTELQQEVEKLTSSSSFRRGDPTTFSVSILKDELLLPGPSDPDTYGKLLCNKFKLGDLKDARVMVVGAGNCGLVAWALEQGASEVLAVEPRFRFEQIVDKVLVLLGETHPETERRSYRGWPSGDMSSIGKWDFILWPEGAEECTRPAEVLTALADLLKPSGVMIVEITHGSQQIATGKVNAFKPSRDAWRRLCKQLTGNDPLEVPGRGENRAIYRLGRNVKLGKVKADPKPPLPAFPNDGDLKTSYRTGSNLPNTKTEEETPQEHKPEEVKQPIETPTSITDPTPKSLKSKTTPNPEKAARKAARKARKERKQAEKAEKASDAETTDTSQAVEVDAGESEAQSDTE